VKRTKRPTINPLQSRAQEAAEARGLYVLFGDQEPDRWVIYDRKTGSNVATYFFSSRGLYFDGTRHEVDGCFRAIRLAAEWRDLMLSSRRPAA
jgi:hypothetical protein